MIAYFVSDGGLDGFPFVSDGNRIPTVRATVENLKQDVSRE